MTEMSVLTTTMLIIATVTAISAFMYSIYKIAKRVDQAIGVDSQGKTLSDRMSRVEHQLWENGGSSLKDQVNDVQKVQTEINAKMGVIEGLLLAMIEPKPKRARKTNLNIVD